uniref:Glycosyltransferase family 1 protein n=1 Tax=Ammonifex degensii TaxID=42838 RepID=A0A7C2I302_9THEO
MRVAMLHWAFPPTIGGVETHLTMLCPALVKRGHQVALLTGAVNGEGSEYTWKGMFIRRTPLMDLNSLTPKLIEERQEEIREELAGFITRFGPDVIHAHNMHYFSFVHADALVKIKTQLRIPLVLTAHNVWADALWDKLLRLRREWDGVIAVSHHIKRELVASGYPAEEVTVIHHGIDLKRFCNVEPQEAVVREIRGAAGNRKVIFHPARMSLAKGSDVVVQAFRRVKEAFPEAFLLLAGTDQTVDWGAYQQGEVAQVKRMIAENGLEGDVLIRFFAWEEMPSAYRESDVVVYPSSFDEPFGLVLLEAMAAGKPLVVTRVGGMPEIVEEGKTGVVIPPRRPDILAEKILMLLNFVTLACKMGEKARQTVQARFTIEKMVTATINFYRRVLQNSNLPEVS